jgi:hypothetical protein
MRRVKCDSLTYSKRGQGWPRIWGGQQEGDKDEAAIDSFGVG